MATTPAPRLAIGQSVRLPTARKARGETGRPAQVPARSPLRTVLHNPPLPLPNPGGLHQADTSLRNSHILRVAAGSLLRGEPGSSQAAAPASRHQKAMPLHQRHPALGSPDSLRCCCQGPGAQGNGYVSASFIRWRIASTNPNAVSSSIRYRPTPGNTT